MSFAIGVTQRGVAGGLLSGALFQYPGLVVMTALGALAAEYLVDPPGWLRGAAQGFGAAGVALVAGAFVGLSTKLCRGKLLGTVSALSAGAAFYAPQPWMFPTLIALGGIAAWVDAALVQKTPPPKDDERGPRAYGADPERGDLPGAHIRETRESGFDATLDARERGRRAREEWRDGRRRRRRRRRRVESAGLL